MINLPIGLLVAAGAVRSLPPDTARANWGRLDVRGALVATASVAALVFAFSQAQSAGWTSTQTLGFAAAGLAGLVAFVASERRVALPLLRVQRLADRAIGGGFVMMLAATAVLFGSFLLAGTHVVSQRGVRAPLVGGFAAAAAGLFLLTGVSARGSYLGDLLPGMLIAGVGLGAVLVSVAFSVLSGAREEETGMLSGLNTTGHEIGCSLGLAVLTTIATGALGHTQGAAATFALTNGIGNAFLAAGIIAAIASLAALAILPSAESFLPRLELAPPATIQ